MSRRRGGTGCFLVLGLAAALMGPMPLLAQDAAAPADETQTAAAAPAGLTEGELRELVAPIALYPDELVAIILPAATVPLQLVEADRYLDAVASDPNVQPNPDWDPSVVALLNYPDVIDTLNGDLAWTQSLGDAVFNEQDAVIDAIQAIRSETYDAGYLQSSDQVAVAKEGDIIIVQSADPEVVYVPTYDPAPIVNNTYVSAPPPVYSSPYPAYTSPVAPFFTGMFFGAAIGMSMDWDDDDGGGDHFHYDNSVDIDTGDITINNSRVNADTREQFENRQRERDRTGQGEGWQPDRQASRPASAAQRDSIRQSTQHGLAPAAGRDRQGQAGARPGDRRDGGEAGLGNPGGGRQQADREESRGDRSVQQAGRDRQGQSAGGSQRSRQSGARDGSQGGGQSLGGSSGRSRSSAQSSRGRQSSGGGGGGGGRRGGGGGRNR